MKTIEIAVLALDLEDFSAILALVREEC